MIMKKLSVVCLCFLLVNITTAQILVEGSGKVGVGTVLSEFDSIRSKFTVNTHGNPNVCAYIVGDSSCYAGLRINKTGFYPEFGSTQTPLFCVNTVYAYRNNAGIYAQAMIDNPVYNGRSYGVCAFAGNATSGWNYGICGSLCGNQGGAGVFGTSVSWNNGIDVVGRYAGFFYGPVKATGIITTPEVVISSDYRLKENIAPISGSSLDNILNMNVVQYNFKQMELETGDTSGVKSYLYEEDSPILKNTHYGLIAQELKEIYPDLVVEGQDGYLSVNYIEIIPLLIQSIQELNKKVHYLYSDTDRKDTPPATGTYSTAFFESTLYQNTPNPFKESTIIECYISDDVVSAVLYIYDMSGKQVYSVDIQERNDVTITIAGVSLDAGMYLYSLITDGNLIDTKRMILTK